MVSGENGVSVRWSTWLDSSGPLNLIHISLVGLFNLSNPFNPALTKLGQFDIVSKIKRIEIIFHVSYMVPCLLDDAKASLNHLFVPQRHQQYVRTSNLAERAFEEERRRTKVIPHLWVEGGLVKLVFAVLLRVSERWGKKFFSEFEQQQIRSLRRKLKLDEQEVSMSDPKPETPSRRSAASAA